MAGAIAVRRPYSPSSTTGRSGSSPCAPATPASPRPWPPCPRRLDRHDPGPGREQRLAEAISSFSLDALAGAVPLNADLDVVLSVLASTVCAALRRRRPGYGTATPDTLQRRFLDTGGIIENHRGQTTIRLTRRTYSPILRQSSLPDTITVPPGGTAGPSATSTTD